MRGLAWWQRFQSRRRLWRWHHIRQHHHHHPRWQPHWWHRPRWRQLAPAPRERQLDKGR
jgi:hypothetical protein